MLKFLICFCNINSEENINSEQNINKKDNLVEENWEKIVDIQLNFLEY